MNLKELVTKLLEDGETSVQTLFFYSEITNEGKYRSEELEPFDAEGIVVNHETNFGGEDMGSSYYSVYSFQKADEKVYVKFDGWYASHVGCEFTEYRFVEPKKVEVIQYD